MFHHIIRITAIVACSAALAWADEKSDIQSAVGKLAASDSYSWTTTVTTDHLTTTIEGKTQAGLTADVITYHDTHWSAFVKGDKIIIQASGSWMSAADIINAFPPTQRNPDGAAANAMRDFKLPATVAADMLTDARKLQLADGGYSADLAEAAVKEVLFTSRVYNLDRSALPDITDCAGTVRFWVSDGLVTKYEVHATGMVSFNNGRARPEDRTVVTEIGDVNVTSVDIPADAMTILNAPTTQQVGQ